MYKYLELTKEQIMNSIRLQACAYFTPEKIILPKEIKHPHDEILVSILNRFCSCKTTMPFKYGKPNTIRGNLTCSYCQKRIKCHFEDMFEHNAEVIIFNTFCCFKHRELALKENKIDKRNKQGY